MQLLRPLGYCAPQSEIVTWLVFMHSDRQLSTKSMSRTISERNGSRSGKSCFGSLSCSRISCLSARVSLRSTIGLEKLVVWLKTRNERPMALARDLNLFLASVIFKRHTKHHRAASWLQNSSLRIFFKQADSLSTIFISILIKDKKSITAEAKVWMMIVNFIFPALMKK